MAKAIWNHQIIAESEEIVVVDGQQYFPPQSINKQYLKNSDRQSVCPVKGQATYYSLEVDGQFNIDACWSYSNPSEATIHIMNYLTFTNGVEVTD